MNFIFRSALKITIHDTPPHALEPVLGPDGVPVFEYWLVNGQVTGDRLLRPQWYNDLDANMEAWGYELVKQFFERGWLITSSMTRDQVIQTSEKDAQEGIIKAYKTYRKKYTDKYGKKPKDHELQKKKARRSTRKKYKVGYRLAARSQLPPGVDGPQWDFAYEYYYQSTEESDYHTDSALDPDTEDEAVAAPVATARQTRAMRKAVDSGPVVPVPAKAGARSRVKATSSDKGKAPAGDPALMAEEVRKFTARPPTYRTDKVSSISFSECTGTHLKPVHRLSCHAGQARCRRFRLQAEQERQFGARSTRTRPT